MKGAASLAMVSLLVGCLLALALDLAGAVTLSLSLAVGIGIMWLVLVATMHLIGNLIKGSPE